MTSRTTSPSPSMSDTTGAIGHHTRRICQQSMVVPSDLLTLARDLQRLHQDRLRGIEQSSSVAPPPPAPMSAQEMLWECLKSGQMLGYCFKPDINLGTFTADFYCESAHLVIEIGDDTSRLNRCPACDCWARSHGFRIVRLHHREIESNLEQVLNVLILMLQLAASDASTTSPQKAPHP